MSQPHVFTAATAGSSTPTAMSSVALRMACFWVGSTALLGTVIAVKNPLFGLSSSLLAAGAMAYAVSGPTDWPFRLIWTHLMAAVIAVIGAAGFCATHCGTFASYDVFLGVPTSIAGVALHGTIAAALLLGVGKREATPLLLLSGVAIGASVFFCSLLLASRTWCSACAAIHALMAVQLVGLLLRRSAVQRIVVILTVIAAAGVVNAVYHHTVPAARNEPGALLSYLRSTWTDRQPPVRLVPMDDRLAAARQEGAALAASLHLALPEAATAYSPATAPPAAETTVQPRASHPASFRSPADANRWGDPQAPITLLVAVDTGCPVCAQQFRELVELRDLVRAKRLQIRFLITYKNDASQATASIAYAAGLLGGDQLMSCLASFYGNLRDIATTADALHYLPQGMSRAVVINLLRHHQDDISGLLTDAAATRERLGATGDPALWLCAGEGVKPQRTFQGLTLAAILRLAANSLDPAMADH